MSSQGGYVCHTVVIVVEQKAKIVCNQALELFFILHLHTAVSDKTPDGNDLLFFTSEIWLFQLVKELDCSGLLRQFQETFRQRFIGKEFLHYRAVNADFCLNGLKNPHFLPPSGLRLPFLYSPFV